MQTAHIVVDLGYGDAGKGSIVDALARKTGANLIVRFNGGGQAAHNVVLPDGRHHTFAQFGSGSFVPGVRTYLSKFFLWNPISMASEAGVLEGKGVTNIMDRVFVDRRALVVTPWHRAMNRLREFARGNARHGSCGEGIGEAVGDREDGLLLRAGELETMTLEHLEDHLDILARRKREEFKRVAFGNSSESVPREDLGFLMDRSAPRNCAILFKRIISSIRLVSDLPEPEGDVIFEGAQGVLIDENHGCAPHNTWSTCTSKNALEILRDGDWKGAVDVTGVLRAYAVRHGAGPFVTEDGNMTLSEKHNLTNQWQGRLRVGHFDAVATHYALKVDGYINHLAITNIDQIGNRGAWKICTGRNPGDEVFFGKPVYGLSGIGEKALLPSIVAITGMPIAIESRGPTFMDKVFNT